MHITCIYECVLYMRHYSICLFICFQFYYAEYPFQSRATNEVSLFEGQVVTVYVKHDKEGNSEWWYVDADGVKGYVPSNYLSPMS